MRTIDIFLIVFNLLLLAYIIYLHMQLAKKNMFIESTVKKLSGIEKSWSPGDVMKFLQEIRKVGHYSTFFTDKLFEDKPMKFLLENDHDSRIYIHYTRDEDDARNILKEGFRFAESFYKTALPVSGDKLDLLIKHNSRKSFGDYMLVLSISDKIFEHYSEEMDKLGIKGFSVENVLTEKLPVRNENADIMYQLSNRFVKGYINHQTGEIVANPDFDPGYNAPVFEKNLSLMSSN